MFFPSRLSYFSADLNPEVKEIYWDTIIFNLAASMMIIFEPIFLYKLNYSLIQILQFYLLVYLLYSVLIFFGAKLTSKIGYKHSIFFSGIFYVIYWIVLYQIQYHPALFFAAPIFFALQKSLFWPPYHADIALHSQKIQRGREVGLLFSLIQAVSILGPVLGGGLIYLFGFKALFAIASLLMIFSAYPLFRSAEIYPKHQFHFRNLWQIFRRYPRNFFAYWGYSEDLMLMTLWPIVIFMVVPQFFSLGLLSTVANLIAIVIMLYVGRVIDQSKQLRLLQVSSVFYGFTWFFRQFAVTLPIVFLFDSLTRTGKAMVNVPMISLTYQLTGSNGPDHAIAYSVFHELGCAAAKIITALLAIWILSVTNNINYVFILAGAFTMFYGLLRK